MLCECHFCFYIYVMAEAKQQPGKQDVHETSEIREFSGSGFHTHVVILLLLYIILLLLQFLMKTLGNGFVDVVCG